MSDSPAPACALPESEHDDRRSLLASTLSRADTATASDRRVQWRVADPEAFEALARVVELERRCCSGLTFTLEVSDAALLFTVAGPAGTRDFLARWLPPGALPDTKSRWPWAAGATSLASGAGLLLCCATPAAAAVAGSLALPLLWLDVAGGMALTAGIGLLGYGWWTRHRSSCGC